MTVGEGDKAQGGAKLWERSGWASGGFVNCESWPVPPPQASLTVEHPLSSPPAEPPNLENNIIVQGSLY